MITKTLGSAERGSSQFLFSFFLLVISVLHGVRRYTSSITTCSSFLISRGGGGITTSIRITLDLPHRVRDLTGGGEGRGVN